MSEDAESNIEGMKCPECGQSEEFAIDVTKTVCVYVSADDIYPEDKYGIEDLVDWDDESDCVCRECGFVGVVGDFKTGNASINS